MDGRTPGSQSGAARRRAAPGTGEARRAPFVIPLRADERAGSSDVQWGVRHARPRMLLCGLDVSVAPHEQSLILEVAEAAFRLGEVSIRRMPDSTRRSVAACRDRPAAFRRDRAQPPVALLRLALAALRARRRLALDPRGRQGRSVVFRLFGLRLAGLRLVVLCNLDVVLGLLRSSRGFGRDSLKVGAWAPPV